MDDQQIAAFVRKWAKSGGAELANYQLFLTELCDVLGVAHPEPSGPDGDENKYVFEKSVVFDHPDGTRSTGRIDLYRRGAFICETKQGVEKQDAETPLSEHQIERRKKRKSGHGERGTKAYDDTMLRARGQAEQYARNLPASEGRPPFLMVIDVGHSIEPYAEFTQTGGVYTSFPDPLSHRIKLEQLADADVRAKLALVWTDPHALDPSKRSAKVTREIAAKLAELAKSLEKSGHDAEDVAQFLMRCLFTMFAEDVGLLDKDSFKNLLERLTDPKGFKPTMEELWRTMNIGGWSVSLNAAVKRFNGGLFAESQAIELTRDQLDLLIEAAGQSWNDVEPAIFGTLLERALDPVERHKLGAHYTPRAYVERLVIPTVVEPLREEWDAARTAAVTAAKLGETAAAVAELERFHDRLCDVKVLDPACGTGNFLYVTLEHLKRLEGEVFAAYESIAHRQMTFEESHTVDPHQLLGIEINPRAAAIAELVLWIGYLQWHYRTRGKVAPPEPIIKDFKNIECRDAVLEWDSTEEMMQGDGKTRTRWDGRTTKTHPVTGEEVPDERAQIISYKYIHPARARWPESEFVIGNPPFIGNSRMRYSLGDGYVDAIREAFESLPESCDYVMYWWNAAAAKVLRGELRRFGLITTNSIRQTFNRRVLEPFLNDGLRITWAVADHPWVDSADGAAVRISMTVGSKSSASGRLLRIVDERPGLEGAEFSISESTGAIHANLTVGAATGSTVELAANNKIGNRGVQLIGAGFIVTRAEAHDLGLGRVARLDSHIKPYRNGKDIADIPRDVLVIDLFGLTQEEVRVSFPEVFQWVLHRVKPERDSNNRASYREKWWIFGEPVRTTRDAIAGLPRYIVTCRTAKHRVFTFLSRGVVPDAKLITIALDDAYFLGCLSSRQHVAWAMATGAWLGVGNDSNYNHSDCFGKFPFPNAAKSDFVRIRALGEQLDAHRKRQQELHPKLTMTGMYNVLEKLRSGGALTAKEKTIHEQGLVSVLKQIHDELDAAVAEAYGWPADLADEEILERLVALNHERAAEEKQGIVRWLRPEFQNPAGKTQRSVVGEEDEDSLTPALSRGERGKKGKGRGKRGAPSPQPSPGGRGGQKGKAKKVAWPKGLAEQAAAVQSALVAIGGPADVKAVAARFSRANKERVEELLETLASLGKARELADGRWVAM